MKTSIHVNPIFHPFKQPATDNVMQELQDLWNEYHFFNTDILNSTAVFATLQTQVRDFISVVRADILNLLNAIQVASTRMLQQTEHPDIQVLRKASDLVSEGYIGKSIGVCLALTANNLNNHVEKKLHKLASAFKTMGLLKEFDKISLFIAVKIAYTLQESLQPMSPTTARNFAEEAMNYYRGALLYTEFDLHTHYDPRIPIASLLKKLYIDFFEPKNHAKIKPRLKKKSRLDSTGESKLYDWTVEGLLTRSHVQFYDPKTKTWTVYSKNRNPKKPKKYPNLTLQAAGDYHKLEELEQACKTDNTIKKEIIRNVSIPPFSFSECLGDSTEPEAQENNFIKQFKTLFEEYKNIFFTLKGFIHNTENASSYNVNIDWITQECQFSHFSKLADDLENNNAPHDFPEDHLIGIQSSLNTLKYVWFEIHVQKYLLSNAKLFEENRLRESEAQKNNSIEEFKKLFEEYERMFLKLEQFINDTGNFSSVYKENYNWEFLTHQFSEFSNLANDLKNNNVPEVFPENHAKDIDRSLKKLDCIRLEVYTQEYLRSNEMPHEENRPHLQKRIELFSKKLSLSSLKDSKFSNMLNQVANSETYQALRRSSNDIEEENKQNGISTLRNKGFFSRHFYISHLEKRQMTPAEAADQMRRHPKLSAEVLSTSPKDLPQAQQNLCEEVSAEKKKQLEIAITAYLAIGGKISAGFIANSNHTRIPSFVMKLAGKLLKRLKRFFPESIKSALSLNLAEENDLRNYLDNYFTPEEGEYTIEYWQKAVRNLIDAQSNKKSEASLETQRNKILDSPHRKSLCDFLQAKLSKKDPSFSIKRTLNISQAPQLR
ncbi:hypothetical protein [Candidiatus Paracoxiella cheracis]|uniref:hypothetical protein n=1 Tax=Candidiatus Paracoxiella cheracis TaxID=3405120 RepID=UPI003BF4A2F2